MKKYNYENSCAYLAGKITAILHMRYSNRRDLPSVFRCMKEFMNIKLSFGKYYGLLRLNKYFKKYIIEYEQITGKLSLDPNEIGNYDIFLIGYCEKIKGKYKKI